MVCRHLQKHIQSKSQWWTWGLEGSKNGHKHTAIKVGKIGQSIVHTQTVKYIIPLQLSASILHTQKDMDRHSPAITVKNSKDRSALNFLLPFFFLFFFLPCFCISNIKVWVVQNKQTTKQILLIGSAPGIALPSLLCVGHSDFPFSKCSS